MGGGGEEGDACTKRQVDRCRARGWEAKRERRKRLFLSGPIKYIDSWIFLPSAHAHVCIA